MIYTDYFRAIPDKTWSFARQSGITHGTIRLPEQEDFDVCSLSQLKAVVEKFKSENITPVVLEPLPNSLHDHIKLGDSLRDQSIAGFIKLMENLKEVGIGTVCFNFMAHYGWTRTHSEHDRGGASVTAFSLEKFNSQNKNDNFTITKNQLEDNYIYFLKAVLPYAEKYDIRLALHPDDPPLEALMGTAKLFTSLEAIRWGMNTVKSPNLGVTFCQSCYHLMGENLEKAIEELREKIFFIHFRNVTGKKTDFRETFHDNGEIDMVRTVRAYVKNGINVPIRVDHVPTYVEEESINSGYDALGRLFAIGYMKGIIEAVEKGY